MEKNTELNKEFKEQINKTFADLFKEIGNNRQQLANKVLSVQMALVKELSKEKIDANRQKEILHEVNATVKMAAQQLPHLKFNAPKPIVPAAATPAPVKTVAPVKTAGPAKTAAPAKPDKKKKPAKKK